MLVRVGRRGGNATGSPQFGPAPPHHPTGRGKHGRRQTQLGRAHRTSRRDHGYITSLLEDVCVAGIHEWSRRRSAEGRPKIMILLCISFNWFWAICSIEIMRYFDNPRTKIYSFPFQATWYFTSPKIRHYLLPTPGIRPNRKPRRRFWTA